MRIRASCLTEALKTGETTLTQRIGTSLWADGLTKSLPAQVMNHFCQGVWLGDPSLRSDDQAGREERLPVVNSTNLKMLKSLSLLAAGAALLPGPTASETCEIKEARNDAESGSWADQAWLVMLAGLVCLLRVIKDLGWELVKRVFGRREQLKVKLLAPGERKLVSLGLALELPAGCYGRIASRSSLALRGIDVAGGMIDPDFRGEVKIILVKNGSEHLVVNSGDRVGQLVLEKYAKVEVVSTGALSSTQKKEGGFGSSGVSVKSVSRSYSEPQPALEKQWEISSTA